MKSSHSKQKQKNTLKILPFKSRHGHISFPSIAHPCSPKRDDKMKMKNKTKKNGEKRTEAANQSSSPPANSFRFSRSGEIPNIRDVYYPTHPPCLPTQTQGPKRAQTHQAFRSDGEIRVVIRSQDLMVKWVVVWMYLIYSFTISVVLCSALLCSAPRRCVSLISHSFSSSISSTPLPPPPFSGHFPLSLFPKVENVSKGLSKGLKND